MTLKKEVAGALADLSVAGYSKLPMHYLNLTGYTVRALSAARGLEKGKVYTVALVTDDGRLQLLGNIDDLFPMKCFGAPIVLESADGKS